MPPRRNAVQNDKLSTEVWGFVLRVSAILTWTCTMVVAYTPDTTLEYFGLTYYPQKYWVVAFAAWLVTTISAAFVLYNAYNLASTASPLYLTCIADNMSVPRTEENRLEAIHARVLPLPLSECDVSPPYRPYFESPEPRIIANAYDVPLEVVNHAVYGVSLR